MSTPKGGYTILLSNPTLFMTIAGPGCPKDTYLAPSASILTTIITFIADAITRDAENHYDAPKDLIRALNSTDAGSIVLIGHSFGGSVVVAGALLSSHIGLHKNPVSAEILCMKGSAFHCRQ